MADSPHVTDTQRFLGRAAALLVVLSLLTGFLVAGAMSGTLPADAHAMLASHLNAMLGAFWVLGVAWSAPLLSYGPVGLMRLARLVVIANYSNWIVTALKAFWRVAGVGAIGEVKNDTIFGLLTVFVVLPSLAAAGAWFYGFRSVARRE